MEELRKEIKFNVDTDKAHLCLGRLYREEGEYDLSLKEFEKAIEVSPTKDEPFFKNKILNEIEITQGKRILESKPRGLGVTLTNRCNIRCIMCNVWQTPWDIPEKTVKEIMELLPYLQRIFWQGGEVFLSPYFEELFEKISLHKNIRQDINTNGLLIDNKWARKLVRANANIIFSIDGVTKKTYESIRRGAKFEDLLKAITLLNENREEIKGDSDYAENKCSIIINLVIMRSNYRELGDFIDFAKQYKFERLQITPVDIDNSENIFLGEDKEVLIYIQKTMKVILEKSKKYGIKVSNWLPSIENPICHKADLCQDENKSYHVNNFNCIRSNRISCYWPWQFLFIDWGGNVKPQCFCVKEAGNVHKDSIEEIWNNSIMQTYRQKLFNNDFQNWCENRCVLEKIPKESLSLEY
jgi:MoaA/NifB/PqqE/SkfB family radical SAM enzyme